MAGELQECLLNLKMWQAILERDTEKCEQALNDGANCHFMIDTGLMFMYYPATVAVHLDEPEILDALLRYGADPNQPNELPFRYALLYGRIACVEVLLRYGADYSSPMDTEHGMLTARGMVNRYYGDKANIELLHRLIDEQERIDLRQEIASHLGSDTGTGSAKPKRM